MRARILLFLFVAALTAFAQRQLSVDQLLSFLRSSIKLKQNDSQVAAELRKVKLTQRLDERTIEELQGEGLGPRAVQALKELAATTGSLPAPPPPAPKPVYVPIPPPSDEEQQRVLAEVTDYARNYVQKLPDFICSQATRKFVDTTGKEAWRQTDIVQERLTYFEKHEDYKVVMVNDKPTDIPHEKLGGAMGSSGEFGSILAEIFSPQAQTEFGWSRWTTINKRPMYVFSYHVPKDRSNYRITSYSGQNFADPQTVVAGHHGEVVVDKGTQKVMRIYLHCEDLPASFPVRSADLTLIYDNTRIGDTDYVLPLRAELKMRDDRNAPSKNDIQFYNYRKFGADTTIQFTDAPPPPVDNPKEQPAK
jgi:hypothetical protein